MSIINVTNSTKDSNYNYYDEGLRTYMNGVFKNMSISLLITGLVAYIVANSPFLLKLIYGSFLSFVVMFAPLVFTIYFTSKIWSMSFEKARTCLWIYAGIMGLSLSSIFLVYTGATLTRSFLVTSATFAGMSLYGNVTKKNLTGMAQFMTMGLIGVIIASLVNLFIKSNGLDFMISFISVIIFSGLTAFDVQRLKISYDMVGGNQEVADKVSIMGALNLYMDFVNLFLHLLKIFASLESNRKK